MSMLDKDKINSLFISDNPDDNQLAIELISNEGTYENYLRINSYTDKIVYIKAVDERIMLWLDEDIKTKIIQRHDRRKKEERERL